MEVIGIIATVLALLWSVYTFLEKRRKHGVRILARLSHGVVPDTDGPQEALILSSSNASSEPVVITSVGLEFPDKSHVFWAWPKGNFGRLPRKVEPKHKAMAWTSIDEIRSQLRKDGYSGTVRLRAKFTDSLDNEFASRPLRVSVDG